MPLTGSALGVSEMIAGLYRIFNRPTEETFKEERYDYIQTKLKITHTDDFVGEYDDVLVFYNNETVSIMFDTSIYASVVSFIVSLIIVAIVR